MRKLLRSCWPLVTAVALVLLAVNHAPAQAKKTGTMSMSGGRPMGNKAVDKAVYDSLRAVIDDGAKLYNFYSDAAGCYHTYRAGLIAIRPFLAQHADLQKAIDDGLAGAEEKRRVAARAFALNDVLQDIRKQVAKRSGPFTETAAPEKEPREKIGKVDKGPEKKVETKQPQQKKTVEIRPKTEEKKVASPAKMARLSGKVTFQGQPITGGWYVTLVSSSDKHTFSTYIRADGAYSFKTPIPPGDYTIAIEEAPREPKKGVPARVMVPQRYQNPVTSGLTVQLQAGKNAHDLQLQ
jgi:hypothetical protein